jgi:hypothetical protein
MRPRLGSRAALVIRIAGIAGAAAAACGKPDHYVVVTVDARPAVHDARALTIALSNGGTTRQDTLALRDQAFPVTFSISTPGRAGDLAIAIDATDENGLVVGHGTASTTTTDSAASVRLDSTDFVVNTDYASDQFPASDIDAEASGFQLSASPDGAWTTAFGDSCSSGSCTLFGRRFDATGKPVQTQVAAGTNVFTLTTTPTDLFATAALAASASTTLALWNFTSVGATATTTGIACRALDASGRAAADQVLIAPDNALVVAVAALSTGNFVASWNTFVTDPGVVRTSIVRPDCTTVTPTPVTVSSNAAGTVAGTSAVATSGDQTLFAWTLSGDLHVRMASALGAPTTADTVLAAKTATDEIFEVRAAGASAGSFVLAVRWQQSATTTGPGRIELLRVSAAGKLLGPPVLVTDQSGSDIAAEAVAIAVRPDGTVLIAWDACGDLGDGSKCGVFGRILRDTGDLVSDPFVIPTTTDGDQLRPSVAGLPDGFVAVWADGSSKPPDVSGQAVRARIIYLPGT